APHSAAYVRVISRSACQETLRKSPTAMGPRTGPHLPLYLQVVPNHARRVARLGNDVSETELQTEARRLRVVMSDTGHARGASRRPRGQRVSGATRAPRGGARGLASAT